MMKCTGILFSVVLFSLSGMAQGIINNGAHIVFNGAAFIYMNNPASGHYLSQNGGIIDNTAVGGTMYIPGNWTNNSANNGFSNDGAGVAFYGGTQYIGGTTPTIFYNVYCISVGSKVLNINTTVGGQNLFNGALTIGAFSHPVDLNGFRLDITNPLPSGIFVTSGYIISETNVGLNPSIVRWHVGANTGNYSVPFGTTGGVQIPLGFNITTGMPAGTDYVDFSTRPTATSANTPWASTVTHMFDPTLAQDGSDEAVIDRWWEITSSSATTATLTFSYLGTENTLQAPYNTGNLGAQWWATGWFPNNANIGSAPAVLAGVGTVTAAGINFAANTYTPMVLSSLSAPLPIELINFTANCNGNQVLTWSTASELNNDYFTVERSDDGISFREIGQVDGAGTSSQQHNYSFIDPQPVSGVAYYRLKQTDFNGQTSTSKIITGETCGANDDYIDAYNSGNGITIAVNVSQATDYVVSVYDDRGRIIINKDISAAEGANNFLLNGIIPATGVYLVKVTSNDGRSFTKRLFLAVE